MGLIKELLKRIACEGHTIENTVFRLIGLIVFLLSFGVILTIAFKDAFLGFLVGTLMTVLVDLLFGIGRKSKLLDNIFKKT